MDPETMMTSAWASGFPQFMATLSNLFSFSRLSPTLNNDGAVQKQDIKYLTKINVFYFFVKTIQYSLFRRSQLFLRNYFTNFHLAWTSFFDICSINSSEEVNLILHF